MTATVRLVIDTATHRSVIALGRDQELLASSERESAHRHGAALLEQIDVVLEQAGATRRQISAIGVGIGPGSFTGLRVGLATAKTLGYLLEAPVVGIPTAEALVRAVEQDGPDDQGRHAVVLPAGAHDFYVASVGDEPRMVPPSRDLGAELAGMTPIAVDMPAGTLDEAAHARGARAVSGLGRSLLVILDERLSARGIDDVAALVPAYVALPRGMPAAAAEMAWSPDLR